MPNNTSKSVKKEPKIFRSFKKIEYLWVIFEISIRKVIYK